MTKTTTALLLLSTLCSPLALAKDDCKEAALFMDKKIPDTEKLKIKESDHWLPKAGDFELVSYQLMSNSCGERFALVTIKNISAGTSAIKPGNIVALMMDGTKRVSQTKKRIDGFKMVSFTMSFGKNKTPIAKLLSKTR